LKKSDQTMIEKLIQSGGKGGSKKNQQRKGKRRKRRKPRKKEKQFRMLMMTKKCTSNAGRIVVGSFGKHLSLVQP